MPVANSFPSGEKRVEQTTLNARLSASTSDVQSKSIGYSYLSYWKVPMSSISKAGLIAGLKTANQSSLSRLYSSERVSKSIESRKASVGGWFPAANTS